jgi:endonuclease G
MKLLKVLSLLILTTLVVACNDDDEGGSTSFSGNKNKNIARYAGLEFPRISNGNSTVITHSTPQYGVTYSLEWDHDLKAQRWTAFYFTKTNKVKNWARNNWYGAKWDGKTWNGDPFQKDPDVPANEQPSVTGEFSGSSFPDKGFTYFQRGHICASEDRVASMDANGQTYYMTNMFPQGGEFNSGIWSKMEAFVRNDWGRKITGNDTLFVVKGGTIDREDYILCRTRSGFIVPRFFFMALLLKRNNSYQAMAFWVEHLSSDHSNDKLGDYVISIRELEQKTSTHEGRNDGIDFFCNLPDDIENSVETQDIETIKKLWGLTNR